MNPRLGDAERALRRRARELAAEIVAPQAGALDRDAGRPREIVAGLGEAGLLAGALEHPEAELLGVALVVEEIGRASGAAGALVAAHLGEVGLTLARSASGGRRDELLADLTRGLSLFASVPPTGGNAGGEERGMRLVDGRISGSATGVTGAALADGFLVFAGAEGDEPRAYLVAADRDGVGVGEPEARLGLNGAAIAELRLTDVTVDDETDRLGDDPQAIRFTATVGRVAHAALAVGLAQAAVDASLRWFEEHEAAARSQSAQWKLADSATETEAARLLTWYAATQDGPAADEAAAMARWLAADAAVAATRRALQIQGEAGTVRGSDVERLYRDAKLMELHAGSNEDQLREVARHLLPDLTGA